ncbi:coiled-coil domain-containing protein 122 [Clupea harengus]|uniref:Coiled-coil domain-containing protein 122 n=1 Tax=Clupea harengus TaxID=7950 RepID=A0A8M1K5B6_CLUHA|nr:coiled-coil domain-containing protein 122 [Clupea harengus]
MECIMVNKDNVGDERQLSLMGTLEEVSLQGEVQANELKEKQQTLKALQDTLSDQKSICEAVELELKNSDRQLNGLLCEIKQIKRRNSSLESQLHEINSENMKLQLQIQEQEESQQSSLASYNAYRNKMEDHKMAIAEAESQMPIYKELMEARELVKRLREKRDALEMDLQNPEGQAAKEAQHKIDDLERQVSAKREMVEEKQAFLQNEQEVHAQLRRDIEIQNRRYDARVKRLRCQLSKAQSNHRYIISDIKRMEDEMEELTRQVEETEEASLQHH